MSRPVFLLTDFGLTDTYVGIVKAVILGITPDATIVDLTHDVPPQDIRAGAFALMTVVPYLPPDAVVFAVVDPGVGTARRPIAVEVEGRIFVGPDNGLISWTWQRPSGPALDPTVVSAVVLDRPSYWLPEVSSTFHGRDVFAPVAAHLARGLALTDVGSPTMNLETIPFPAAHQVCGAGGQVRTVRGEVLHVDRYGNLISNIAAADLPADPVVSVGGRTISGLAAHYQGQGADTSERDRPLRPDVRLVALVGSTGFLEVAVPNGSAASALAVGVGAALTVTAREAGLRPPA